MPGTSDESEECASTTGYHRLLRDSFKVMLTDPALPKGGLAVVYDKNPMEATGYAEVLAELMDEPVYQAEFYANDPDPPVKWNDGVMHIRDESDRTSIERCRSSVNLSL
jgi:hypothetical protein